MENPKSRQDIALEMHLWIKKNLDSQIKRKLPETQVWKEILLSLAGYVDKKIVTCRSNDLIDFTDRVSDVKKNSSKQAKITSEGSFLDALEDIG